jgi:subtilisin-like proprotein convertase family protein
VSNLVVVPPNGATTIQSITIRSLSHTWGGDTHIVLQAPGGARYNLLVLSDPSSPTGGGCADDLGGDYTIVDPVRAGCGVASMACGSYGPGTYTQNYSSWTSGNAGLNNIGLESIPIVAGVWSLYFYDWYPPADGGSLLSWEMCFGSNDSCATGGPGGGYPAAGASGGTWDSVLPTGELVSSLAVTVPNSATKISAVTLHGLSHTWGGDTHIVLQAPSGTLYNLLVLSDASSPGGGGCGDDLGGDYTIVDPVQASCGVPNMVCGGYGPGTYLQNYSSWTSGNASLLNVGLESIPMASGTWTLRVYDWFPAADSGNLTSWDLCFDTIAGPTGFCTAGLSTNGCVPSISADNQPSVTLSHPCTIAVTGVEGQRSGLVFYSISNSGWIPVPWGAGSSFLCIKPPTQRTTAITSGGINNTCTGTLVQSWNTFQSANPLALGNPFLAGQPVYAQGWYRDPPSPKTTNLSNALMMTCVP